MTVKKPIYWLVLLANWALVPFAWLTYAGGGPVWGLYLLIQMGTIVLNDKVAQSRWTLAFLCANLMAATAIAHKLSSSLYCEQVSSDYLSYAIGELGMYAGVLVVLVLSAVAIVAKGRKGRQ